MKKSMKPEENSIGYKIDQLINSNLKNWQGKEIFFNSESTTKKANQAVVDAFKANKIRNKMITEINKFIHNGPSFHFRNYHNY